MLIKTGSFALDSIIYILFISILSADGQQTYTDSLIYSNHIFNEKIKTVQLYKEGWNLSYPVIKLNSSEKLILHFDLLDDQAETYYYTFIHCDKDWNKSDIFPNDYLMDTQKIRLKIMKPPSIQLSVIFITNSVSQMTG